MAKVCPPPYRDDAQGGSLRPALLELLCAEAQAGVQTRHGGTVTMGARHDQIAGKAKELEGKVTGDKDREAEGKVQHAQGDVEKAVDDTINHVKGASKAVG